jgi:hypothetical protein
MTNCSPKRAALVAWAEEHEVTLVFFDGFDDAIVGVTYRHGMEPVVLYDRARCIGILTERDGMDPDEAEDFFGVNTEGTWVGAETPAFLIRVPEEEEEATHHGEGLEGGAPHAP